MPTLSIDILINFEGSHLYSHWTGAVLLQEMDGGASPGLSYHMYSKHLQRLLISSSIADCGGGGGSVTTCSTSCKMG